MAAVTRQDIHKFHAAQDYRPRQANLVIAVLSKAFSLAELWEMRPEGSNPCRKSSATLSDTGSVFCRLRNWPVWAPVAPRGKRRLAMEERRPNALPGQLSPARSICLLYTGCRLSEVLNLRWDHIDFAAGLIKLAEDKVRRATARDDERAGTAGFKSARNGETGLGLGSAVGVQPETSRFRRRVLRKRGTTEKEGGRRSDDVRMHDLRHYAMVARRHLKAWGHERRNHLSRHHRRAGIGAI